jgi:hypothetical protein
VSKFLSQETGGLENAKQEMVDHETEVLEQFRQTIRYVPNVSQKAGEPPGRYEVALPWIDGSPPRMPTNFGLTIGRLRSTLKRLRQNPDLLAEYDRTMRTQVELGILERVEDPRFAYGPLVHYLPHQPVVKQSSETTKLRIVFDASAGSPCLNDALEKGKVYAGQDDKQICFILARVRTMPHILVMDLEKAFLQIEVRPQDREATRILWPADPWSDEADPEVYRFARVTFGLSSAPFLLGATVEYHLETHSSEWSRKLINGSYVDNYILPIEEASIIPRAVSEIRELFWNAGFNCRQFGSNCRQQIEALPVEWQERRLKLGLLGVKWDTEFDTLSVSLPEFEGKLTRRAILSQIASVFDPCGWIGPCLLPAKRFQAELWRTKLAWDDEIPHEEARKWQDIMQSWSNKAFCFPRYAFGGVSRERTEYQLQGFADASTQGLGLVVYARRVDDGQVGLLFAKSLVIPTSLKPKPKKSKDGSIELRDITVPRLELQAISLLARAVEKLEENLRIYVVGSWLWTDATIVIHWLKSGRHK